MTIDRGRLFPLLEALQPDDVPDAPISVPRLVRSWLAAGPRVFEGDDRRALEELCRQIDVRKKVSVAYAEGWAKLDGEKPAAAPVVSGLVAVLLANAARLGDPGADGSLNDGWGLKCVNSALKAIDLQPDAPHAPELRAWALEALDRLRVAEPTGSEEGGHP